LVRPAPTTGTTDASAPRWPSFNTFMLPDEENIKVSSSGSTSLMNPSIAYCRLLSMKWCFTTMGVFQIDRVGRFNARRAE